MIKDQKHPQQTVSDAACVSPSFNLFSRNLIGGFGLAMFFDGVRSAKCGVIIGGAIMVSTSVALNLWKELATRDH